MPKPVSYQKDYESAIRKLNLTDDEEISLDDTLFESLVEDNWDWKQTFSYSNSTYAIGGSNFFED